MTAITAAVGGGTWATGATWVGGVAPGAGDDAILAPTSGSVTLGANAACRSLTCTGYLNTLALGANTLSIGDGTAGAGNSAAIFDTTMGLTSAAGSISFVSTSATQQTITTNGKVLPTVTMTFNGAGGSWLLADDLSATSTTLTITAGTFATGNKAISCGSFSASGAGTRVITLGSSAITLSGATITISGTNITWTANTAVITMSAASPTITCLAAGTDVNGASFVYTGSTLLAIGTGPLTCKNFTITGPATFVQEVQISASSGLTCSGTFNMTGQSLINRVRLRGAAIGTQRTVTAAVVSITNCDFRDIVGAGAGTWSGTSIGDCGGNSGITFTNAVTRYGVVAGNFSSTAVWSASSGGAGGASVPLPQDSVILNGSSGAGSYVMDMPRSCKDLTCTSFTATLNHSAVTSIYGSLALCAGMTFSGANILTFEGRASHTITSGTIDFPRNYSIDCGTGTYTLTDNYTNSRSSVSAVAVASGTFDTAGFSVTLTGATGGFTMTQGTLNLGATVWQLNGSWNCIAGTINAGTSTIWFTDTGSADKSFTSASKTYYDLKFTTGGTGKIIIAGSPSLNSIIKSGVTTKTIQFTTGITVTLTGNGSSFVLGCDYLSLTGIIAAGGATFYAGSHSTDGGSNTGWSFTDAPGGSGTAFPSGLASNLITVITSATTATLRIAGAPKGGTMMLLGV